MLGLGNSIGGYAGGWSPGDESTLEAWYKFGEGITLNGSDVSAWADSSSNTFNMTQATATKQPAYSNGILTFTSTNEETLASSSAFTLDAEFVIGFKVDPQFSNTVILGHSSVASEMIKLLNNTTIRIKPDTSNVDFTMESGHDTRDDSSWIIVRKNNDTVSVYKDLSGVLVQQDSTKACAGDFVIDTIGRRAGGTENYFNGTMKEIVVFKGVADADSDALRDNIYERLKGL